MDIDSTVLTYLLNTAIVSPPPSLFNLEMVYFGAHLRYSDWGGGVPPVLLTSHRIWTNPTIGPWDKWGGRVPPSPPRGYATAGVAVVRYR